MTQTVEELERLADEAIQRGQFDVAIRHSRELTKISPDTAQGWFLSGRASRLHGDLNSASAFLEKAVNLESSDTQSLYELAYCYFARGDSTNSLELLERLESLETADPLTLGRVAPLYNQLGEHSKSLVLFEKVVVQEPETARFHLGLAETLRFHGEFDKAEKEYNAAIRCDSHCYEAYLERANVGTWTQASNHTRQIEALLESGVRSKRGAAKLFYALAKEYDDLDEIKRAFINMARAGELLRQINKYDVRNDLRLIDEITNTNTRERVQSGSDGFESAAPIFIVGMPRTGTTLVERILGSHSEVYPAGELYTLITQLHQLIPENLNPSNQLVLLSKHLISESIRINHKELGEGYIQCARPRVHDYRHFTDKLPMNFYYIGLIRMALPNARIIHVTRDPIDTCLSNFKQYFAEGAHLFSYSLGDLGAFYVAYRRLMNHWHDLYPDKILDVSYEDLVNDMESETRRMLDYCALEWEPGCLKFYENRTPTTSRSARQVRAAIYTSSTGAWKRYEQFLQPLMEYFRANFINLS